jgi:hypothetical protein
LDKILTEIISAVFPLPVHIFFFQFTAKCLKGELVMERPASNPSRMVVVEDKDSGERFLVDLLRGQSYDKQQYKKITYEIPLKKEFWDLPRLGR